MGQDGAFGYPCRTACVLEDCYIVVQNGGLYRTIIFLFQKLHEIIYRRLLLDPYPLFLEPRLYGIENVQGKRQKIHYAADDDILERYKGHYMFYARKEHIYRDNGLGAAVFELHLQLVLEIQRICGDSNSAHPESTIICNGHLGYVRKHERNPVALFHPEAGERPCEPVGESVELFEGYLFAIEKEGGMIRESGCSLGKDIAELDFRLSQRGRNFWLIEPCPWMLSICGHTGHYTPPRSSLDLIERFRLLITSSIKSLMQYFAVVSL